MGRPEKSEGMKQARVVTYLPPDVLERIEGEAKAKGVPLSVFVRTLVLEALQKKE